jgi:3-isopropylmalate/(R)-2-methylmalate dehydratase small subunit
MARMDERNKNKKEKGLLLDMEQKKQQGKEASGVCAKSHSGPDTSIKPGDFNKNTAGSELLSGKAFKFGDDISTDLIAPGRYFHLRSNLGELAKHVLEDADPEFAQKVRSGDFVVGGRNFGLGSSREHAPTIIKLAGVGAVLAKSFARIFFRNSINIGLPILICDTDKIDDGDKLQIDLRKGIVKDLSKNIELKFNALPEVMIKILSDGGLVEHITKNKGFNL